MMDYPGLQNGDTRRSSTKIIMPHLVEKKMKIQTSEEGFLVNDSFTMIVLFYRTQYVLYRQES